LRFHQQIIRADRDLVGGIEIGGLKDIAFARLSIREQDLQPVIFAESIS
jgi:hypothetical protein